MDINLEIAHKKQELYERQFINVIHDLKNPFLAIQMTAKEEEDVKVMREDILDEANDGVEMLENLRLIFKVRTHMPINEEPTIFCIHSYIRGIVKTHIRSAEKSKNKLITSIDPLLDSLSYNSLIKIPRKLVKRITNNFITNSLKHTHNNNVTIRVFMQLKGQNHEEYQTAHYAIYESKDSSWQYVGSEIDPNCDYLVISIEDCGEGIEPSRVSHIFNYLETDQRGANWDGCGLGLSICEKISRSIDSTIKYRSKLKTGTIFQLFVKNKSELIKDQYPYIPKNNYLLNHTINHIKSYYTPNYLEKEAQFNKNENLCMKLTRIDNTAIINDISQLLDNSNSNSEFYPSLIIAEDNHVINKMYQKYLNQNSIPYLLFTNGKECYEFILSQSKGLKFIIITDNQMPLKSGIEMSIELRNLKIDCYIVLVSADQINDQYKYAFDEVFEKPFQMNNFKVFQNKIFEKNNQVN